MEWFNFSGNQYSFSNFSLVHVLYLLFFVLMILVTYAFRESIKRGKAKKIIRYGLIGFFLLLYISFYWWYLFNDLSGNSLIQNGLPLHWCGMIGYLSVFMLITRNRYIYGIYYFWALTAPVLGLIFPAFSSQFGIDHYRLHQYFLIHGSMLYTVFFLRFIYDMKPTKQDVYKSFYALILMTVFVYIINRNLGTNYLYLVYLPNEYRMFSFMKYPYHIFILLLLMFIVFNIEFLIDKKKRRSTITYG